MRNALQACRNGGDTFDGCYKSVTVLQSYVVPTRWNKYKHYILQMVCENVDYPARSPGFNMPDYFL